MKSMQTAAESSELNEMPDGGVPRPCARASRRGDQLAARSLARIWSTSVSEQRLKSGFENVRVRKASWNCNSLQFQLLGRPVAHAAATGAARQRVGGKGLQRSGRAQRWDGRVRSCDCDGGGGAGMAEEQPDQLRRSLRTLMAMAVTATKDTAALARIT